MQFPISEPGTFGWIRACPLLTHISGYRGHVVLIDFWEFTCINYIRDFAISRFTCSPSALSRASRGCENYEPEGQICNPVARWI